MIENGAQFLRGALGGQTNTTNQGSFDRLHGLSVAKRAYARKVAMHYSAWKASTAITQPPSSWKTPTSVEQIDVPDTSGAVAEVGTSGEVIPESRHNRERPGDRLSRDLGLADLSSVTPAVDLLVNRSRQSLDRRINANVEEAKHVLERYAIQ